MGFDFAYRELTKTCEQLLADGTVSLILGFERDGETGKTSALFLRKPEDVCKLVWDESCAVKLAKYLLEKRSGKVGIVAKPCDSRALVMLMQEGQVKREDVFIIGMDCPGMVNADGSPAPGCESCVVRVAPVCDVRIESGEPISVPPRPVKHEAPDLSSEAIDARMEKFRAELSKCILCYSCRQACCGCYCVNCFMDRTTPNFLPGQIDEGAKMTYHLGRAMHLAGRCVECGECQRVCPSNVDVRFLIEELTNFIGEEYNYNSGIDVNETPALAVYRPDDREVGFLGGE